MLQMEPYNNNNNNNNNNNIMDVTCDPFSSLPLVTTNTTGGGGGGGGDDVDKKSASLGFMELLGFQDYYSMFDNTTAFNNIIVAPPSPHYLNDQDIIIHKVEEEEEENNNNNNNNNINNNIIVRSGVDEEMESSSVVLNGQPPSSPTSSSICTSPTAHHQPLHTPCVKENKLAMGGDATKAKKKKKEKAPRFAFMTRTDVDHLDDGYRWRKYGQKAVKNSRFPRSYFRCTSATCNVKKRVERCMDDPAYVITTYEGQHTHPPAASSAPLIPSFNRLINTAAFAAAAAPPAMLKLDQGGLLQDMLPCHH